ncbi:MAG: hypothetical protein V7676_15975 [Parasphingorhabdus sp.]|uniref:hypothetical protein n=1 Tax=Parasphingorhabdus sp. TaxID=2709688 RepID=UPI003001D7A6
MRITIALSALLFTAGCSSVVPAPAPAPTQAPTPAPTPPPVEKDWTLWPLAPGNWVYRADNRGSIALYGPSNMDATFIIRCDRDRKQLFLSRKGAVPAAGAQMTLRASSGLQSYPAQNSGGQSDYVAISLPVTDYMMDRIASSRGRFAVETTGLLPLAIPIWPEFTRVVEDCRG